MSVLNGKKISILNVTNKEEEDRLIRIIKEIGGIYTSKINSEVFCILAKKVGSPRHNQAKNLNIPLIEIRWLFDCRSKNERLELGRYMIKCFLGLVICCTGYDQEDKEIMTKFIQDNDGEYSPKVLKEKCTHLIIELEDIDSAKYKAAKTWGSVQIVTMAWVTECNKQKTWIQEHEYLISTIIADIRAEDMSNGSTSYEDSNQPKKLKALMDFNNPSVPYKASEISANEKEKNVRNEKNETNEKNGRNENITSRNNIDIQKNVGLKNVSENVANNEINIKKMKHKSIVLEDLPSFELLDFSKCERILNGDTFFISGFTPEVRDYILRLILVGGGARHHVLTAEVNKILLGTHTDERLLPHVRNHPFGAKEITLSWLIKTIHCQENYKKC